MRISTFLLLLIFSWSQAAGQISFVDATSQLSNQNFFSGAAIGVVDLNGDGLDDIVRARSNNGVVIDLQNFGGGNFSNQATIATLSGSVWSLCSSDLNNDGINDLSIGTFGRPTVLTSNASPFYTRSLLSNSIFAQGLNNVDMNNDGDLDIFVCHDVGLSTPYAGNGQGNFVLDYDLMPAYTDGSSDNSGNYGSLWTDYDNDGDLDMYMSRCRGGVGNPNDPRRMNNLYRNNGDGTYTDVAVAVGLRPYNQTWATDFADLDNDGDLDVVMVNHQATSRIYEQLSNGTFVDRSAQTGISQFTGSWNGIQVFSEDFDNDGDLDILMTAAGGHFIMENNGNFNFSLNAALDAIATTDIQSAACGDLNNDGFLDLIAGHSNGLIGAGSQPDQLFLNSTNSNNWLRVRLSGSSSNTNGIGARMELHGNWGLQIREMRSGESYGIMNSLTDHFGIGSHQTIDSLIVRWPSGSVSTIVSPSINQTIVVQEASFVFADISETICDGDSYQASNGQSYSIAGTYNIDTTTLENGDQQVTRLTLSLEGPYSSSESLSVCSGTQITLPDGRLVFVNETTSYTSNLMSANGCDSTVTTQVNAIEIQPTSLFASVCQGGDFQFPDGGIRTDVQEAFQFSQTLTSVAGCDSLVVTTVIPDPPLESTEAVSVCVGNTYVLPDGQTILVNFSDDYFSLISTADGCDSVITTQITALQVETVSEVISVCQGGSYQYPDGNIRTNVQEAFQFTQTLTASSGCDSIVLTTVAPDPPLEGSQAVSLCVGSTYVLPDGQTIFVNASDDYFSLISTAEGCDSVVTTQVTAIPTQMASQSITICQGGDFQMPDGSLMMDVQESFDFTQTLTSDSGCDSILITTVTPDAPLTGTQSVDICVGTTYVLPDGQTIFVNASDDYFSLISTAEGCDSVVTTQVTAIPTQMASQSITICQGGDFQMPDGSLVMDVQESFDFTQTLTSDSGCDSILITTVTPDAPLTGTQSVDICVGTTYVLPDGQTIFVDASDDYFSLISTAEGCDSVVTTQVTAIPTQMASQSITICQGGDFQMPDGSLVMDVQESFDFTQTLTADSGCDSILITTVSPDAPLESTEAVEICEGTTYVLPNGQTIVVDATADYLSELSTAEGCDSIVTTQITMLPAETVSQAITICQGGNFQMPDGTVMSDIQEPFQFTQMLTAGSGCDSILVTTVTPDAPLEATEAVELCEGASYTLPDGQIIIVGASADFVSELSTAEGCDSVVTTQVTSIPIENSSQSIIICQGGDFQMPDGTIITDIQEAFQFSQTLTANSGCDSLLVTMVSLTPAPVGTEAVNVCRGSSFTLADGSIITDIQEDLSFELDLETSGGCDSVLHLNITVQLIDLAIVDNDSLGLSTDVVADSYQWYDCENDLVPIDGATEASFIPPYNGSFSLVAEVNGCLETSTCLPYLFSSTTEPVWGQSLKIYPNPTAGHLQLELPAYQGALTLELYSAIGQLRLSQVFPFQEQLQLNLNQPAGMYLLRLRKADNTEVIRRIIIH